MQTNDFEKQLQQQMGQFKIDPDNAVWQKVEARITKDKKRKRFLIFWFFIGVAILAGSFTLWNLTATSANKTDEINQTNNNQNPSTNYNSKKDTYTSNKKSDTLDEVLLTEKQTAEKFSNKNTNSPQKSLEDRKQTLVRNNDVTIIKEQTSVREKEQGNLKFNKSTPQGNSFSIRNKITEKPNNNNGNIVRSSDTTGFSIANKPIVDSSLNTKSNVSKQPKTTITDTAKNIAIENKKQTKKPSKWKTGFELLTGFSNNAEGIDLATNRAADNFFLGSPSSSIGSTAYAAPLTYKSTFGWGLGFYFERKINNRFSFSAGVTYQNLAAVSNVGQRIDSSVIIYDSATAKSSDVTSFYRSGQTISYKNHYQFLTLPVNIRFRLNANAEKPISLLVGVAPGLMLASKALYHNYLQNVYYEEKNQFQKWRFDFNAAFSIPVFSSSKYLLQVGPNFQYQLNNLTKQQLQLKQHLYFIGLKTNLLFKK